MKRGIDDLVAEILSSRKYRDMPVQEETVRDLLERELHQNPSQKDAVKTVRQKLHNIVAPYLGDPDYEAAQQRLVEAAASGPEEVKDVCRELVRQHASSQERLALVEKGFFQDIFSITGVPDTVLDLACGINPLFIPWMGLPAGARYYAYDIHAPRVEMLNHFLRVEGMDPLAEIRDVLINPPKVEAPVAFLFKEAHRMEQRQRGCSRPFWMALNVRYLAVSLPAHSLSGRFDLVERQRHLVSNILGDLQWTVTELILEDEMVFVIDKLGQEHPV